MSGFFWTIEFHRATGKELFDEIGVAGLGRRGEEMSCIVFLELGFGGLCKLWDGVDWVMVFAWGHSLEGKET